MNTENGVAALLQPDTLASAWMFAGAIGLSFALIAWGLMMASASYSDPLRRRLDAVREEAAPDRSSSLLGRWLERLRPYAEPKQDESLRTRRLWLVQAGLRSDLSITILYASKVASAVLLAAGVALAAALHAFPRTGLGVIAAFCLLAGLGGWFLPNAYVHHRLQQRKRALLQGFPDALDLLVACTEAGLGLNAAIERVAEQMSGESLELGGELQLVNAEIRAGVERGTALRNLVERTGLEDIRGLVALITHSMRFGSGIADTLRIYADDFRDRRTQRAEASAALIGTKMIFPLCFCIFPAFFVVAIGPAVLGVLHVLSAGNVVWPTAR